MTRIQKIGPKDQKFEVKEFAIVSVDAHDGTIIRSVHLVNKEVSE